MANKEKQEYDYEGDMAMSQLKSIIANAQRMHDMLKVDTNLPEWVQSKITLAEDYITTASNYMQGEMSEEADNPYAAQYKAQRNATHRARVAAATKQRNAKMNRNANEEVAINSVGAGNVAGLQGEPPVNKKKKNVMSFNRFMKK
jgi:serine protease inhibitor